MKRILGRSKSGGYLLVRDVNHPRAANNGHGYVGEHILVAEKVLGKYLPLKAKVHHINENPENNRNSNLVVCENESYHKLLHSRKIALKECGNANYVKCTFCGKYDTPLNIKSGGIGKKYHKSCNNEYERKRRIAHATI